MRGIPGFDSDPTEVPFVVGELAGVRYFKFRDFAGIVPLRGSFMEWVAGENVAECHRSRQLAGISPTTTFEVPHDGWRERCGCGFWGFWKKEHAPGGSWDVLAVIEGFGRVVRGPRGFRASKAKLKAFTICTSKSLLPLNLRGEAMHDGTYYEWVSRAELLISRFYDAEPFATEGMMLMKHPLTPQHVPPKREGDDEPTYAAGGFVGGSVSIGGGSWIPVTGPVTVHFSSHPAGGGGGGGAYSSGGSGGSGGVTHTGGAGGSSGGGSSFSVPLNGPRTYTFHMTQQRIDQINAITGYVNNMVISATEAQVISRVLQAQWEQEDQHKSP